MELLRVALFTLASLCFVCGARPPTKFFVTVPNVLHVDETENVHVFKVNIRGATNVDITVENTDDGRVHSRKTVLMRHDPRKVEVKVQGSLLGRADENGRIYVRVRAQCREHNFRQEVDVLVSQKSGDIFVQIDKPIYIPKQTVYVRVFALNEYRRANQTSVMIDIKNPDGMILMRSREQARQGIANITYSIPDLAVLGNWSVVVHYGHNSSQNKSVVFEVKKYVLPHFRVSFENTTSFILDSTTHFTSRIGARYVFNAPVVGIALVTVWVVIGEEVTRVTKPLLHTLNDGQTTFSLPVSSITDFLSTSVPALVQSEARLQIEATVTETSSGVTERAVRSDCHFAESPYIISTTGVPWSFSPGLPLAFSIDVRLLNGKPAPGILTKVTFSTNRGNETDRQTTDQDGLAFFEFQLHESVTWVKVEAVAERQNQVLARKLFSIPKTQMEEHIRVTIQYLKQKIDASGRFDTNFMIDMTTTAPRMLHFMLLSGGRPMFAKQVEINENATSSPSIRARVDHTMAPLLRAVAWYVTDGGHVIAGSTKFRVESVCGYTTVEFGPEHARDSWSPGEEIRLQIRAPLRSTVALLAVDKAVYSLRNNDQLTSEKLFSAFGSRDLGCGAGGGRTAKSVFELAGLSVLSDSDMITGSRTSEKCQTQIHARKRRAVGSYRNTNPRMCCITGMAYASGSKIRTDAEIDSECRKKMVAEYSSSSIACRQRFYSCCTQVWANKTGNSGDLSGRTGHAEGTNYFVPPIKLYEPAEIDFRSEFPESFLIQTVETEMERTIQVVSLPDSITTWSLQAVSMSAFGMCVAQPQEVLVKKDVFVKLLLPHQAVLGEQLEVKAIVYNTDSRQHRAEVKLRAVEGLCTEVEGKSDQVKIERGNSHTFVWPVVPLRTGRIQVSVQMFSTRQPDAATRELTVVPSGIHTSLKPVSIILDPMAKEYSGRQYTKREGSVNYTVTTQRQKREQRTRLNLKLPEDAIKDTHSLTLGFIGKPLEDVVTAFMEGAEHHIQEAVGCGEQSMAGLGPSVSAARYIQYSPHGLSMPQNAHEVIDRGVGRMLSFRHSSGAFGMYPGKHTSIWLTAFVVKTFSEAAQFSALLKADPSRIICSGVSWLLTRLRRNVFYDYRGVPHIWGLRGTQDEKETLTAYVLLAIDQTNCSLSRRDSARIRQSVSHLVKKVKTIRRPYTLALVTLLLAKKRHPSASKANHKLLTMARPVQDRVPSQRCWRHRLNRRLSQEDVETTAYGVLAQMALGRGAQSSPYVRWLMAQRTATGLFKTTQTTVVGLQALTQYSIHVAEGDVNMLCLITSQHNTDLNETCHITNTPVRKHFNVTGVAGGDLIVQCQGSGTAQMILHTSYYSDHQEGSTGEAFTILTTAKPKMIPHPVDGYRPSSDSMLIEVCARTRHSWDGDGATIVDVGLGSGFDAVQSTLDQLVADMKVDLYEKTNRSVLFYVSRIPNDVNLCLNFMVKRHYKVNRLRPVAVTIYSYYEPERLRAVRFYHPTDSEEQFTTQGRCLPAKCPKCYGYNKDETDPLRATILKRDACSGRYDYVFEAKFNRIHQSPAGLTSLVFNISAIAKEGADDGHMLRRQEVQFSYPEGCVPCNNLNPGAKYLIMGSDGPRLTNKVRQYNMDDTNYVVRIGGNKPNGKAKSLWSEQRNYLRNMLNQGCHL